jgi:hypothetical protein
MYEKAQHDFDQNPMYELICVWEFPNHKTISTMCSVEEVVPKL